MNNDHTPHLFIVGGIAGIVGTLCYVIASMVPMSRVGTYVLAMAWPILSTIFVFSLFRFVGHSKPSAANHLAFLFASLAFVLVAAMMSAQLAVKTGMEEYIQNATRNAQETLELARTSIRLVDMGLDVAWDLFIGTALLFLAFALQGHPDFGLWWSVPSALLGLLLMVLNVATFPWPPDTQGLLDIGPAVGLFIIVLSGRLLLLGNRMKRISR